MTQGPHDLADRIGSMLDDGARRGPIFQSVLEAVLRVLDDVSRREQIATAAAMSLGHRQVLQGLVDEVRWTIDRLATLRIRAAAPGPPEVIPPPENWWFALSDAQEAVDAATRRLSALVAGQARGSAVRTLVGGVVRLLRSHDRLLTGEASRWIEG